jgi:20S proteasome alpha/beta subunit
MMPLLALNASSRRRRRCIAPPVGLLWQALLLLVFLAPILLEASSSSSFSDSNYNVYHYDLAVQHFTPDGRLLQVEYATAAAEQSSPLVVCQLDATTLAILSLQKQPQQPYDTKGDERSSDNQQQQFLLLPRPHQDRIVVVEGRVAVAMSGVLADNIALLTIGTRTWREWKSTYGDDNQDSNTMQRILASSMAEQCQKNSCGGGIRPFGATMLVIGMNPNTNNGTHEDEEEEDDFSTSSFSIVQIDPSGSVVTIPLPRVPNKKPEHEERNNDMKLIKIVGGTLEVQSRLEKEFHRLLQQPTASSSSQPPTSQEKAPPQQQLKLWDKLGLLTQALITVSNEEDGRLFMASQESKQSKRKTAFGISIKSSPKDEPSSSTASSRRQPQKLWIEAVLLSTKAGDIHRLTDVQVQTLLHDIQNTPK